METITAFRRIAAPHVTDATSGVKSVSCAPASGSLFAVGTTVVTCAATDNADNTSFVIFAVTVRDTVPPVIAPHGPVTADATSAAGATVRYISPATTDAVDGAGTATCSPLSGSVFPLGVNTVKCDASDAAHNAAVQTTFTVTVSPRAVADVYSVNEDATLAVPAGGVLTNDLGFDVATPNLQAVQNAGPSHGSLTLNASGGFSYSPSANYNGTDSFSYHATYGALSSNVVTVTITVNPVNDAPVANADTLSATEDTSATFTAAQLLGNDTDAEGDALTIASVASGTGGTVVLNAGGTVTFTPALNFNGPATFTYRAKDASLTSNAATVTVNVAAVNDAPVASNLAKTVTQGQSVSGQIVATDVDSATLTYSVSASPAFGTLTLNTVTGAFTYTANATAPSADSFTVIVSDGSLSSTATVSVTISPVGVPVKITGGGTLSKAINFGFNVQPVQDGTSAKGFKGHLEYQDKGITGTADDLQFKSTAMTSEYASDSHHGTFSGTGTLNGVAGYTFTVTVEDNARQGAGNDKFRIRIYDASNNVTYDSNAHAASMDGILTGGKIKIHYDKDAFNTTSLEGAGSFLAGSLNFDIDVRTDATGGYNGGAGVQFTDATNSYTLSSVSIDTMKVGAGIVTVTGPVLLNGVQAYRLQADWDIGKLTLRLRIWDSAGKQLYDSKTNQLTSGSCRLIASN